MKVGSIVSIFLLFLLLQMNHIVFAGDVPCNDLDDLILNMDKLNNALDKIKPEEIDGELDKTLKDVADSLVELGTVVPGLSTPAGKLQKAHKDKDLKAYQSELDNCTDKLNVYYKEKCKKKNFDQ